MTVRSFAFLAPEQGSYMAGTVNQMGSSRLPVRWMMKVLDRTRTARSSQTTNETLNPSQGGKP